MLEIDLCIFQRALHAGSFEMMDTTTDQLTGFRPRRSGHPNQNTSVPSDQRGQIWRKYLSNNSRSTTPTEDYSD